MLRGNGDLLSSGDIDRISIGDGETVITIEGCLVKGRGFGSGYKSIFDVLLIFSEENLTLSIISLGLSPPESQYLAPESLNLKLAAFLCSSLRRSE